MNSSPVPGNRIVLLESGAEYFPALVAAIEAARVEIHLETYIFADDDTGRRVVAALCRAAARGVAVRVLVDGYGAREFPTGLGATLPPAGVELLVYRPELGSLNLRRSRLRRLHRKQAVIDGRIAFVGGINVIDDMDTPGKIPPRFDYAVSIEGPLVGEVHAGMRHVWRLVRWVRLGRRPPPPPQRLPLPAGGGNATAALLVRDNLRHRRDIENAYLAAIDSARADVLIANAYFLPGRRFHRALVAAAARGVRVRLLLQGRVEYALMHYATQALYERLLAGGVEIWEYRRSFLHAKVAAVDADWATVGSSNIDPFSLLLAREANVVVFGREFCDSLRASLQRAMKSGAVQVRPEDMRRRSWLGRLVSRLAYGTVRLLIGITGYGGRRMLV